MHFKRILFLILPPAFFLLHTDRVFAVQPFEGIITYKITYPGSNLTESQLALFPKSLTVMIKGVKSRTDILTGGGSRVEITDHQEKTKIKLLNMMGQKYAIMNTADDIAKDLAREPSATVTLSNETKTIAGYTCKKALVSVKDKTEKFTFEVYYTPELGGRQANFDKALYKDIDGVLLEFSMKTPELTMRFIATSVEKKPVMSTAFDIPADYSIISKDELKNKIGNPE
jgi:hypothetical protein